MSELTDHSQIHIIRRRNRAEPHHRRHYGNLSLFAELSDEILRPGAENAAAGTDQGSLRSLDFSRYFFDLLWIS